MEAATEEMTLFKQTEPLHDERTLPRSIYAQATIHEWQEELQPYTDKLFAPDDNIVEAMLVPLPSRVTTRNLWSYSEKILAVSHEQHFLMEVPVPGKSEPEDVGHDKPAAKKNFLL